MGLALAGGLLVMASLAQVAEIEVLSGNSAEAAVRERCTQFERATGNKINLHFEVNADIQKKIEAGEGRAGLGVAVRQGTLKPDISSVDAFRRALLAAKAFAYPGKGASGSYFVSLLDRMGIKEEMQGELKPLEAEDIVEVVARGDADLVVVVATRIVDVGGVDMVGPIPKELQTKIGFAARLYHSKQVLNSVADWGPQRHHARR